MSDPVDWYTAGKLMWAVTRNTSEMPVKILLHPADRFRLMQRLTGENLGWDGKTVFGVPIQIGDDPTEHVAELVYERGPRRVPVVFDPIDFEEPIPIKMYKDGAALAEALAARKRRL